MKRWWKWAIAALVLALLAAGVFRALSGRKAQQAALAANTQAQTVVELTPADLVAAVEQALQVGVPISGTVRAVNSAVVKARVAGEVQALVVREGDAVKAGQVVARIEPTEFRARQRQAQDQADAAKAQVAIAQRQLDNNQALVKQGFISATALDTSQANLNGAQATYQAALAAVDIANKAVQDSVLVAPMAGLVAQRLVQPGERVGVDARVIEIVDLRQLELEATLSASDALDVRVGQSAVLRLDADSARAPRTLAAKVARINPTVQAGSRSVVMYLALPTTEGLRQGTFLQGVLGTGAVTALAVPLTAVRTDKPAPYVQAVNNSQIVHLPVGTGQSGEHAGERWVAVTGLPTGTQVVRGSVGALREGTPVKLAPTLPTACGSLPPEGAAPCLGRPGAAASSVDAASNPAPAR